MENNKNQWLEIGTIVSARGLKGELKVLSSTDFPERFEIPGKRWLQPPHDPYPQAIELISGKSVAGKNIYIVRLEGIENRNQAETLRGYKLLIMDQELPELEEEEYHVSQLINVQVYHHKTGELLGTVIDLFTTGHDLLEIQLINNSEREAKKTKERKVLIPFVYEIVPVVDLENNRIEINPPKGLLSLGDS
ncbi:rRNA processing protein [Crocosphaera subtropica ATCC 51142]|uniref:Ribosome maturation factor RimM n=1 Tax=Crocosphaera subtropica (strain ATCC 51142 / BH68) TaxID=43989 RepID=RIMM_CROS5|nr:ribosome maturation factor RimM [Crocosphaera subtropica]B1WZK0.1 RecName: Full=Ribosome maturation factor RimM [Crocosphaera subtropica ATCC 51142]ACB51152.1 rRNA processing protein [Crocosphaera subtropica ATCC 51142]